MNHIILFSHFYLFQNDLIDILTTVNSDYIKNTMLFYINVESRVLKLQINFSINPHFISWNIFSLLMVIHLLSLYLHFKQVSQIGLKFHHVRFGDVSTSVLRLHIRNHLPESWIIFPKKNLNNWLEPKQMRSLQVSKNDQQTFCYIFGSLYFLFFHIVLNLHGNGSLLLPWLLEW